MAQIVVRRSSGEEVALLLHLVDRQGRRVTIDVPEYNSRFTFSDVTGRVVLIKDGRQTINENQPAVTHVSRSVYAGMARWAGSILNDRRG